jgi:spermidine synthase
MPCSYFHPDGGVGLAFRYHPRRVAGEGLRIGVLGLGVGGIAAYADRGDTIRYYEINPDVIYLARDAGYFTYLTGCPGKVETVLGDARISLERELKGGSQQFDVLVMDAFSGDTVPAHLLTREAFEVYLKHLRQPDGVIIVNVTNRFLDLPPVVYEAAHELGLEAVQIHKDGDEQGTYATADFMLLTRPGSYLHAPQIAARAEKPDDSRHVRLWTDDFHNMFQILR